MFLTSCSSSGQDNVSQSVAIIPSETPEPTESAESDKAISSPKVKPSKKSIDGSKNESSVEEAKPGSYLTLREYEGSKDLYINANVVLFFNANWCSTCKIARDNIESNLDSIPSDLVIVVVDFDSETELRKKYGVTIQHTFIQVDMNGNQLAKWSGSVTAEEIAKRTV